MIATNTHTPLMTTKRLFPRLALLILTMWIGMGNAWGLFKESYTFTSVSFDEQTSSNLKTTISGTWNIASRESHSGLHVNGGTRPTAGSVPEAGQDYIQFVPSESGTIAIEIYKYNNNGTIYAVDEDGNVKVNTGWDKGLGTITFAVTANKKYYVYHDTGTNEIYYKNYTYNAIPQSYTWDFSQGTQYTATQSFASYTASALGINGLELIGSFRHYTTSSYSSVNNMLMMMADTESHIHIPVIKGQTLAITVRTASNTRNYTWLDNVNESTAFDLNSTYQRKVFTVQETGWVTFNNPSANNNALFISKIETYFPSPTVSFSQDNVEEDKDINPTYNQTPTVSPVDAAITLDWTSSNPSVATVASDGTVTMLTNGTTTITATVNPVVDKYLGGNSASYTLVVSSKVLEWSKAGALMRMGTVYGAPTLTNDFSEDPTYSSTDPTVATIDTDGNLTLVGTGTTTISATIGLKETSYVLNVVDFDFNLSSGTHVFTNNGSTDNVTLTNSSGLTPTVVSETIAVATAAISDNTVTITPLSSGNTNITATIEDAFGNTLTTTYVATVKDFYYTTTERAIQLGATPATYKPENHTLSADYSGVTFTSANEVVATVDASGSVTPIATGTATITAHYTLDETEYTTSYDIEVVDFMFPMNPIVVVNGKNKVVTLTDTRADKSDAIALTFAGTASIDESNVTITGTAEGDMTISASVLYKGTTLNTGEATVQTRTFTYTRASVTTDIGAVSNALTNTTGATATFTTSDASVAALDASGNVVAIRSGTTTVTATITLDEVEYSTSYDITVNALPAATAGITWDFTTHTTTAEEYAAATEWTENSVLTSTSITGTNMYNTTANGALTLNGVELNETKGLTFNAAANKIAIKIDDRLYLNTGTTLTLPLLLTGSKVHLETYRHSSSLGNTFALTNLEDSEGTAKSSIENSFNGDLYITSGASNATIYANASGWARIAKITVTPPKTFATATLTYARTGVSPDETTGVPTTTVVEYGTETSCADKYDVTYVSSDPSIATVDATGNVTGHKHGEVTITAVFTPKDTYEDDYYPTTATTIVGVNLSNVFSWVKNGEDLMAEGETFEVNITSVNADNLTTLPTINLGSTVTSYTVASSNPDVAGLFGAETYPTLRIKKKGETTITATGNEGTTITYTLRVNADDVTGTATGDGLYTFDTTGQLTASSFTHNGLTMSFDAYNAIVVDDNEVGTAIKMIDRNGFTFPNINGETHLPVEGDYSGTYFKFQSGASGTLTLVGHFAGVKVYEEGDTDPKSPTITGNTLTMALTAGKNYFFYNTDPNTTPLLHAFGYSISEEIDFSKFEWYPNNNGNNKRLDRLVPRWNIQFNETYIKYMSDATSGHLTFQSNDTNGRIIIEPRSNDGMAENVTIKGVWINVVKAPGGTVSCSASDGTSEGIAAATSVAINGTGWFYLPLSPDSPQKAVITRNAAQEIVVNKIRIDYSIAGTYGVTDVLDVNKVGPKLTFPTQYLYLPTNGATSATDAAKLTVIAPTKDYNATENKFLNVITIASSNTSVATVSNTAGARTGSGDYSWIYNPTVTMVAPDAAGFAHVTATYAGNDYFAETTHTLRVYGYDYEEPLTLTLAPGESYETPATSGQIFELTAQATEGTVTAAITGAVSQSWDYGTTATKMKTTVTSTGAITISNPAESTANLVLTLVKVSRRGAQVSLDVKTPRNVSIDNVAFTDEQLNLWPTIAAEEGDDIEVDDLISKYDITFHFANASFFTTANDGTLATDGTTTVHTASTEGKAMVYVRMTPKAANVASFKPVTSAAYPIYITDGFWDINTDFASNRTSLNTDEWTWNNNDRYDKSTDPNHTAEWETVNNGSGERLQYAYGLQTKGDVTFYFDKGTPSTKSNLAMFVGSSLRIPARKGMTLTMASTSTSDAVPMTIDNVDKVTEYYSDSPAYPETYPEQSFTCTSDGYVTIHNANDALYTRIFYIRMSAEIHLTDGDDDGNVYVEAGTTGYVNTILNTVAGDTFTYEKTTSNGVADISSTGVVTLTATTGSETFKITGTGANSIYYGKEKTYTIRVMDMAINNTPVTLTLDNSLYEKQVTGSYINDLAENVTVSKGSDAENAEALQKVVFSVSDNTKSSNEAKVIYNNATGKYSFEAQGLGDVTIKATLGQIERTFVFHIVGVEFAEVNPVIPHYSTDYKIDVDKTGGTVNSVSWTIESRGNVTATMTSADDDIDKCTFTIAGSGDGATDDHKKGGIIAVKATINFTLDGDSPEEKNIMTVVTVPYETHVFDFDQDLAPTNFPATVPLSLIEVGWYNGEKTLPEEVGQKKESKDDPDPEVVNYYWNYEQKMKSTSASNNGVFTYRADMNNANGMIIAETSGLQITNEVMTVGVDQEDEVKGNPAVGKNLIIKNGCTITIPQVPAGKQIDINWVRHNDDQGNRIRMKGLLDVGFNTIDGIYKIAHTTKFPSGDATSKYNGTYTFFVAGAKGELTDVVIECVDATFLLINRIELCESNEYRAYNSTINHNLLKNDNTAADLTLISSRDVEQELMLTYNTALKHNTHNGPTEFEYDISDIADQGNVYVTSGTNPTLRYKDTWGKVKLTLKSYTQDKAYVSSQYTWIITIGKHPHQTYPYTWDFTTFSQGTKESLQSGYTTAEGYGSFSQSGTHTADVKTTGYGTSDYLSYYVDDTQLMDKKTGRVVPELAGLGFNINGATAEADGRKLSINMPNTVNVKFTSDIDGSNTTYDVLGGSNVAYTDNSGGGSPSKRRAPRSYSALTMAAGTSIIVPEVKAGHRIYIKATSAIANATNVTVSNATYVSAGSDAAANTLRYDVTADGDATISFVTAVDVMGIGVTDIVKTMHGVGGSGWATWSTKDNDIDHSLTGFYTTNDVNAYKATYENYDMDKATITLTPMKEGNYYVPKVASADIDDCKGKGLVLMQDATDETGTYDVPLFVPAPTTLLTEPLSFPSNMMVANPDERTFTTASEEEESIDGDDHARFILTDTFWEFDDSQYDSNDGGTAGNKSASAGFYRMHVFANSDDGYNSGANNVMPANSAYLAVATDKLPVAVWNGQGGEGSYNRIKILIDGRFDEEETGHSKPGADSENDDNDNNGTDQQADNEADGEWFTLSGVPLGKERPAYRGVYIHNGRKVVVR